MTPEIGIALLSLASSLAALAVALLKKRKPSLQAAVARGVAYAHQVTKPGESKLETAAAAVIREDIGDNGKRDWLDSTIRFEIEALLNGSKGK